MNAPRDRSAARAAVRACGDARESAPAGPPLPPLQLRPMLAELKALALQLAAPAAPAQRELRELGDVALQLVEADPRTAALAERSLREHADAWWVLEPAFAHDRVEVRRRAGLARWPFGARCVAGRPGAAAQIRERPGDRGVDRRSTGPPRQRSRPRVARRGDRRRSTAQAAERRRSKRCARDR
jgi:hypothetical protein